MKHTHHDIIVAFANGEKIEYLNEFGQWNNCPSPGFYEDKQYRIAENKNNILYMRSFKYVKNDSVVVDAYFYIKEENLEQYEKFAEARFSNLEWLHPWTSYSTNIKNPHPKHDIILAYLEGKKIQTKFTHLSDWIDQTDEEFWKNIHFHNLLDFRIKPETRWARMYLTMYNGVKTVNAVSNVKTDEMTDIISSLPNFDQWVSDWAEYEI